jgi:hypothetical protein
MDILKMSKIQKSQKDFPKNLDFTLVTIMLLFSKNDEKKCDCNF